MRVLAIYIEPTPYILDLIRVLKNESPALQLSVLFITEHISQPWGSKLDGRVSTLLQPSRISAAREILTRLRKGSFDWLHLAGWGHPLLILSLAVGRVLGLRISVESDTQMPTRQSQFKRQLKDLFYPFLFRSATLFFPGGTPQSRYLKHYRVSDDIVRIAQMTVDVTAIAAKARAVRIDERSVRESLEIPEDSVVFAYVGRLEPRKGVLTLLQAFSSRSTEATWRLLVTGDGSLRREVEAAAQADSRIHYLGRKDTDGVIKVLASADAAVVPSITEPWGLVVNEAMAAGLPIVATERVGAVEDLVAEGQNGLVVPADNPDMLAMAMQRLADDKGLRTRMSAESLRRISRWRLEDEARILVGGWNELMRNGPLSPTVRSSGRQRHY